MDFISHNRSVRGNLSYPVVAEGCFFLLAKGDWGDFTLIK